MIVLPETTEDIVVRLLRLANTKLPSDIGWALEAGAGWETSEIAYSQLGAIMDNAKKVTFLSGTGPWEGDMDDASGMWLTVRDEDTWKKLMKVVNEGGDPNDVVEGLSAQ